MVKASEAASHLPRKEVARDHTGSYTATSVTRAAASPREMIRRLLYIRDAART
jgi:hypothetical protein